MGSVYRDISRGHSPCPFPWHQGRARPGRAGIGHHFHHEGRGQSGSSRDTARPPPPPEGQDDAESKNGFGKHDAKQICSFRHSMCRADTFPGFMRSSVSRSWPGTGHFPKALRFDQLDLGSDLLNFQFFANRKMEMGK